MREISTGKSRNATARRLVAVLAVLTVYAGLTAALYGQMRDPTVNDDARVTVVHGAEPPQRNLAVRDGWFWVDGQRFAVRSVGWDPVRPGELPWQRAFHQGELEADLRRIREAGFNVVRTWAPLTPEELALVERHGLRVLQGVWVQPDGDFADPEFRRRTLGEVARAVEASRWSPAILGYLVLNEPRATAVATAGLEETRAFLRELVATVRAVDPSAPIGYASWPGMEALDDPLLDFVAFNVYPHRPRVVMDELGLGGYVALLRRSVARGRPLVISEFGISVSPQGEVEGRGGATEAEQATGLVRLASSYLAAGAVGLSVFQWSDGWWKNDDGPGDETEHDEDDPEEWFGLIRFADVGDRTGEGREALAAMAANNRALLLEPRDGPVSGGPAPVVVYADEPVTLEVSVNGGQRYPVELWSGGGKVWEGKLLLPDGGERVDLSLFLMDEAGTELRQERRLLRLASPRDIRLAIEPSRLRVEPGAEFEIEVRGTGADAPGTSVSIATYTEDQYNEQRLQVALDEEGVARVRLEAPDQATLLTLLAFEDDPATPPAERATSWAAALVRQP